LVSPQAQLHKDGRQPRDTSTSNIEDIRDPRFFSRQVEDERENMLGRGRGKQPRSEADRKLRIDEEDIRSQPNEGDERLDDVERLKEDRAATSSGKRNPFDPAQRNVKSMQEPPAPVQRKDVEDAAERQVDESRNEAKAPTNTASTKPRDAGQQSVQE
jgi:hypothetical protein